MFTDRSKAVLLLWILNIIYGSCLSCCLVCSLQSCGRLLGKGLHLGSLMCDVFLCFVTFPCGVLGQMWYLIVSILDLCLLFYFFFVCFCDDFFTAPCYLCMCGSRGGKIKGYINFYKD